MDFLPVLQATIAAFDAAGIRYALIGGFAMGLHGVQRATMDVDFILMLDDLDQASKHLDGLGFRCIYRDENVSHYRHEATSWGQIDLLHAFRVPSLGMLTRSKRMPLGTGLSVPVVALEDLIGLKIQASVNDPTRALRDWQDIEMTIREMSRRAQQPDWELISDYLEIFDLGHCLAQLKDWYGAVD